MPSDLEIFMRLILSIILSGLIGLERQIFRHTAGLRTHILVSLGSCLIMLTSLYVFDIYKGQVALDPARLASGVITGVGFLCAGAIIREREKIRGLTTAASLWVVAGLGLAVGCGLYSAAVICAILALIVLVLLKFIEDSALKKIG